MITIRKNMLFMFCLFIITTFSVLADSVTELCDRFGCFSGFYAKFIQKITDSRGNLIQESNGELWIQKPNCFKYHVVFPEEIFLISNGEILWFYDPCVNQVVVSWLKDILNDKFLMLLINNSKLNWNSQYSIQKNADNFFLIPKNTPNSFFRKIAIQINNKGVIKKIEIFNNEGNNIICQLTSYDKRAFNSSTFNFLPPTGVNIDEQRW